MTGVHLFHVDGEINPKSSNLVIVHFYNSNVIRKETGFNFTFLNGSKDILCPALLLQTIEETTRFILIFYTRMYIEIIERKLVLC